MEPDAQQQAGLIDEIDLNACADHRSRALLEAEKLRNFLNSHEGKLETLKDFLDLREVLGLNEHNVKKLQLEEEPLDTRRLRHCLFLKLVAHLPLMGEHAELWDLDGMYDNVFPGFSDLTYGSS